MSDTPSCNSCNPNDKDKELQKKADEALRFKENIAQISSLSDKFLDDESLLGKKSKNTKIYNLILTEYDENNGSFVEYNKEIDSYVFFALLDDVFDSLNDLDYEENDEFITENNIVVFDSLDEVIDFLKNKKEKDE